MKTHEIIEASLRKLGGKGSGHHGHKGIPGRRGGSAPRGGAGGGVVAGVQLPQTGLVADKSGKILTTRYPDIGMSGEMLQKWDKSTPEGRAGLVMSHAYMSTTRQAELGPMAAYLQHTKATSDVPTMGKIDQAWTNLLNSPSSQLPGETAIKLLQTFGYGKKSGITVEGRKKYGV